MKNLKLKSICVSLVLIGCSSAAFAGGFALMEQNASGAGTAYAGKAAIGEDASAAWFNPASMSLLKSQQLTLGLHAINVHGEFKSDGTSRDPSGSAANDGGNPGGLALLPNFHYVRPINEKMNFGLSVAVPFGLKTDYQNRWVGRFQGVTSEIKTVDINPSLSYAVDERLSVGAGVSLQYLGAKLTQAQLYPTGEGLATIKGENIGYGFNVGALLKVGPATRIGVAYRSEVKHDLKGTVDFSNTQGQSPAVQANAANSNLTSTIKLPASLALSSVTALNNQWNLLTDFTWTQWSSIQQLKFDRSSEPQGAASIPVQNYNWRNTMRYAVGATYQYSQKTKLKFGVAYDESPVTSNNRKVRLPDENRIVLAVGSQYQLGESCRVDVGFQYVKSKDAGIRDDQGNQNQYGLISGKFKGEAQILSTQFNYVF